MSLRTVLSTFAVLTVALSTAACSGGSSASDAPVEPAEGALTTHAREGGRFETFKGIDDKNYFRLVAANGLKLLRSEAYERTNGPDAAIDSMLKAAHEGKMDRFEVLEAGDGGYYVNVTNANPVKREILGTSEVYSSRAKAVDASKVIMGYLKGIAAVAYEPAQTGKRFRIVRDDEASPDQPFKFFLHAANGEVVLRSEWYASKQKAEQGIEAVKRVGGRDDLYKVWDTPSGDYAFFTLKAENGEAVGHSELYASRSNANRAKASVSDLLSHGDLDVSNE